MVPATNASLPDVGSNSSATPKGMVGRVTRSRSNLADPTIADRAIFDGEQDSEPDSPVLLKRTEPVSKMREPRGEPVFRKGEDGLGDEEPADTLLVEAARDVQDSAAADSVDDADMVPPVLKRPKLLSKFSTGTSGDFGSFVRDDVLADAMRADETVTAAPPLLQRPKLLSKFSTGTSGDFGSFVRDDALADAMREHDGVAAATAELNSQVSNSAGMSQLDLDDSTTDDEAGAAGSDAMVAAEVSAKAMGKRKRVDETDPMTLDDPLQDQSTLDAKRAARTTLLSTLLPDPTTLDKRTPKPGIAYTLLTPSALKHLLRESNLSPIGDKPTLIKRHREFTIQHNANLDALFPVPQEQVVARVEEWERNQAGGKGSVAERMRKGNEFEGHKESKEGVEGVRRHMERYKGEFRRLIEEGWERKRVGREERVKAAVVGVSETGSLPVEKEETQVEEKELVE
ncbi:hypothetical protein HDU98_002515 [Podochytrium sp. JEL0797]|nr:hypothetical protein HDU98_002515 [Podochytrium sp. JEL0797]